MPILRHGRSLAGLIFDGDLGENVLNIASETLRTRPNVLNHEHVPFTINNTSEGRKIQVEYSQGWRENQPQGVSLNIDTLDVLVVTEDSSGILGQFRLDRFALHLGQV
jgi:hypothetical protein